jgi:hypothetical protein
MNIRFLTSVDVVACNDFYNRIYGNNRTVTQWLWEFGHYSSELNPFILVEDKGEILATQALIPIKMVDSNGVFLSAKSEETLIDPTMRGKGLFGKMYKLLFEYAAKEGIQVIWGFTPAYKPFEGIGFTVPGRTSQLLHPFSRRALSILKGELQVAGLKGELMSMALGAAAVVSAIQLLLRSDDPDWLHLELLEVPPSSAEVLCTQFIQEWGGTTILRDAEYLQWRYYDNPYVKSTLVGAYQNDRLQGWLAFALDSSGMGYIVDTIVVSGGDKKLASQVLTSLIRYAIRELRAAGATAVRSWRVNDHPFDIFLTEVSRGVGFYHISRGEPAVVHPTGRSLAPSSLSSWDNWYVSRAFTQGNSG